MSWKGVALPDDPGRVPVWQPYLRGERVPFHDRGRRASLHDLDIGMGTDEVLERPWRVLRVRHERGLGSGRGRRGFLGLGLGLLERLLEFELHGLGALDRRVELLDVHARLILSGEADQ